MQLAALALLAAASGAHALRVPSLHAHSVLRPMARSASVHMLAEATLEETIKQTTSANDVVIFSKSWCPYCAQCKALFDEMGQPYTAVELDLRDDGAQLQATLLELTQQRTVPNVFVNGEHLGGNDDTQQAARSGKLATLLSSTNEMTGNVVPTADASTAITDAMRKAVAEDKMITETEATIRKVAGVGLGLVTAFLYSTSGMAYTALSAGIFGSLSVYRSGASYQ